MLRVLSEDADLAPRPPAITLKNLDRGRLPGTVRAEKGKHLAAHDPQVYSSHRLERAVPHPQAGHLDDSLSELPGRVRH